MPRPKTGDKRAAILRAATKTIAEDGIGASTARVVRAAAVAEGSPFRYFPDKDKLLNELYRELKLDMRSAMIAGFPVTGSLRKRVQHVWNAYVSWGTLPLKIENYVRTFSILVFALSLSRHGAADEDLPFAAVGQRLLQIIHRATNNPGFARPADARTAAESGGEPSLFRNLEQSAALTGPCRLDP